MITRQSIYEACNGIMPYTSHPTVHPNIYFAGGDLFSPDSLSHFDGLLAFVYGGVLHKLASFADMDNDIKYPHIFYGGSGHRCRKPTLRKQKGMIIRGLDDLAAKGCRNIAFHGGSVTDATYVEGARECVRTIVDWIDRHPGEIESITLVDLGDDYYFRFGHLLPWSDGHIRRYARHDSEFEWYFDKTFREEVEDRYDIYDGLADRKLNDSVKRDLFFETDRFNFSIGVFYMNLIPQAIAKVTMNKDIMHDFLKCAGWPEISCSFGGPMHSDVVLRNSGLFPGEEDVAEWKKAVLGELEFFKAFTRDVIAGDIWMKPCAASERLIKASPSFAEESINEIHRLVYDYIRCLDEGKPAPTHIVLGENLDLYRNQTFHKEEACLTN